MKDNTGQPLWRSAMAWCLPLLVALLILEAVVRVYLAVGPEAAVPPALGRPDSVLGWSKRPGAVASSSRTGQEIQYRINSKGLRDDGTTYEKPPGVFRIVALGDSNTFGFGVPIEKHFTRLLEGYFNGVEVVNLGVDAFGVDQQLLYLQHEGLDYDPDIVIAFVPHYGNQRHMHATRFGAPKPRFRLDDAGDLVLEPVALNVEPETRTLDRAVRLSRLVWAGMIIYQGIRSGGVTPEEEQDAGDTARLADSEFVRQLHELGFAIVRAMDQTARSQGAEFLLVTGIDRLHTAALDAGLRSLDIRSALGNPLFSLPDSLQHINEAGNGVLAWEISRYLVSEGLIPPRPSRAPGS